MREGLHAGAKHAPDAPCVMREMCPSGRAKCAITSLSGHHVRPNDASGEPSSITEQAVPGKVGLHRGDLCDINDVTICYFLTLFFFFFFALRYGHYF